MLSKLTKLASISCLGVCLSLSAIYPVHAGGDHDAHAHHRQMMKSKKYKVERDKQYNIPNVNLVNHYGKSVNLKELMEGDEPILLQFIFTSCATICPVLSATFDSAQDKLVSMNKDYKMISISIDPEHDKPSVLRKYAKTWNANQNWQFLTGTKKDIFDVIKAFDALYGGSNKMYHKPYFYIRPGEKNSWTRIDGMVSSASLISEYHSAISDYKEQQVSE